MASKQEVQQYLKELKVKMEIFGILFLDDRGKNQQTLHDLEISPAKRKEIISSLKAEDYSQGPLDERAVCISFHIAEHPMNYPLKK
jgi:hypothetical protein